MERSRWWLVLALTGSALAIRTLPAADVFSEGGVRPFPDDSPYHVIRAADLTAGRAGFRDMDRRLSWPEGAVAHWPWGFDLIVSVLSLPFVEPGASPQAFARPASLVPPLLGALLVPLVFAAFAPVAGRRRALACAGIVAFLPASADFSIIGRVDHHVMEPILLLLSLAGPLASLGPGSPRSGRGLVAPFLSGVASGLTFAFIPAAMPFVLIELGCIGLVVAPRRPDAALAWIPGLVVGTLASLGLSAQPFGWHYHAHSFTNCALVAVASTGAAGVVFARLRRPEAPTASLLAIGAASAVVPGLALWVLAPLRDGVVAGWNYVFQGPPGVAVFESEPVWQDPKRAAMLLSGLAPLALAGIAVLVRATGNGPRPDRRLAGLAAAAVIALGAIQRRFLVAATPLYALALVEGLAWAGEWIGPRLASYRVGPRVRRLAAAGIVAASFVPSLYHLAVLEPLGPADRAMYIAAEAAAGLPQAPGREGALVPWSWGHVFQYAAGRPTVCDNFSGTPASDRGVRTCMEFLYGPADGARAFLERLKIGLVVLVPPDPGQVRTDARILGLDPGRWVDPAGRFTAAFLETTWAHLGVWASRASRGDSGPAGVVLLDRIPDDGSGAIVLAVP